MTDDLSAFRETAPPPLAAVQQRVRRRRLLRRARGVTAVVVAAGAAALLALQVDEVPEQRDRGLAGVDPPRVLLSAVADGPGGPRSLGDGDEVNVGERVVFFVTAERGGAVALRELGAEGGVDVIPFASWSMAAGEHAIGEGTPVSWRPDRGPGDYRYVLSVCPPGVTVPGSECGQDTLALRFTP